MKIRTVQFAPYLGNIEANYKTHVSQINRGINDGIDLIVFPELSLTGYQLKDIIYDLGKSVNTAINGLKELSKGIDIIAGVPIEGPKGIIYNSALFFSKGDLVHTHRKVQLPNFGMFEEKMIFKPGNEFRTFKIGNLTAGILICREILFPINAYLYYLQNTDIIISISNSPHRGMGEDGFASHKLWERLGEVYSINLNQNFVFCNRTGFEDGIGFGGGSFFATPANGIVKMGKYYEEEVLDFTTNEDDIGRSRIKSNYLRDERPDVILRELQRIING